VQSEIVLNDSDVRTAYSNFARVTATPEEVILDFALNPNPFAQGRHEVKVTERVVLNFFTAKRLCRAMVATLQRMYRHFYFRICDICNTARLIDDDAIGYAELESAAKQGGIWPGVATYLKIVADYAGQYRGIELPLPKRVAGAAMFGAERISVRTKFLRVPMMPEGAKLYTREVKTMALKGNVPATFRLSLLPPLASVAAIAYKITGSDKGVW